MTALRANQQGASLVEAMVALLLLAFGVMGMATLQTRTLIATRTTFQRATAVQAAEDLRDRMQVNREIRREPPAANPYLISWGEPPAAGRDCQASTCDGLELAAFDLHQWKSALSRALPDGDAVVFASDKDPTQFGVLVAWTEARARNESSADDEEAALYRQSVAVRDAAGELGTGAAGKECLALHTCHLIYIRP